MNSEQHALPATTQAQQEVRPFSTDMGYLPNHKCATDILNTTF